jgi:hypothetical protein
MKKFKGHVVPCSVIIGSLLLLSMKEEAGPGAHQGFIAKGHVAAERNAEPGKEGSFRILTPGYTTFKTGAFVNIFSGRKNSIVKIAPELIGLTGIRLPGAAKGIVSHKPQCQTNSKGQRTLWKSIGTAGRRTNKR